MKKYDNQCGVISVAKKIAAEMYDFTVQAKDLAEMAEPGQFAQVRLPGRTLRRPISICGIDKEAGTLRFVFQVRGEGTAELAAFRAGDALELLAPLGHGFPVESDKKVLLVGGGIGVPPLLGVAAEAKGNAVAVLGFRNRDAVIMEQDFIKTGAKTIIATDDGSCGFHGLVTDAAAGEEYEMICACGPKPMLRAVAALAQQKKVPCYLSLEERMACGVGACLGCATPLRNERGEQYYGHVCKDGPVFDYRNVILE